MFLTRFSAVPYAPKQSPSPAHHVHPLLPKNRASPATTVQRHACKCGGDLPPPLSAHKHCPIEMTVNRTQCAPLPGSALPFLSGMLISTLLQKECVALNPCPSLHTSFPTSLVLHSRAAEVEFSCHQGLPHPPPHY